MDYKLHIQLDDNGKKPNRRQRKLDRNEAYVFNKSLHSERSKRGGE